MPGMGGITARSFMACVLAAGSIWMPSLKSALIVSSCEHTKSGAVNAGALIPPSGYAERRRWIIYPLCSKHSRLPDAQNSRERVGVTLTASQACRLERVRNRKLLTSRNYAAFGIPFADLNTGIIGLYYFYLKLRPNILQFGLAHNVTAAPLKWRSGLDRE